MCILCNSFTILAFSLVRSPIRSERNVLTCLMQSSSPAAFVGRKRLDLATTTGDRSWLGHRRLCLYLASNDIAYSSTRAELCPERAVGTAWRVVLQARWPERRSLSLSGRLTSLFGAIDTSNRGMSVGHWCHRPVISRQDSGRRCRSPDGI